MMEFPFTPEGWQALGSMLQGAGTVGGAFAVWLVARRAVRDWREQKQVENQISAADRVLTDCYNLSHFVSDNFGGLTLSYFDSIIGWNSLEDSDRAIRVFESFERAHTWSTVEHSQLRKKLEECRSSALIYFGQEAANRIDVIIRNSMSVNTWICMTLYKDLELKERFDIKYDDLNYKDVTRYSGAIQENLREIREQMSELNDIVSSYIRKI